MTDQTSDQPNEHQHDAQQPDPEEIMESDPSPEGDFGVSSERVGHTGPGQVGVTGIRDTGVREVDGDDVPPEQRPGAEERNPEGIPPKAARPRMDPRSDDEL